jgi:hypothetical protein
MSNNSGGKRPTVEFIPIELGGKDRNLLIDFNALSLIEEKTGLNTLSQEMWNSLNATNLKIFLWACLVHEDEELSLSDVGRMIHIGNMNYINEKLTEAYKMIQPDEEDSGGKVAKKKVVRS